MVEDAVIAEAGRRLAQAAGESAQVILFGSHARGDARPDSDLDFLVIEPAVENRGEESVRLRRELRGLGVAADVVVVSADHVAEWGEVKSTMLHHALNEGRVLQGRDDATITSAVSTPRVQQSRRTSGTQQAPMSHG